MHLEVLVEEESAQAALEVLLPRIIGSEPTFQVHPFRGKKDLLRSLPVRLRAYARWVPGSDTRILILADRDQQDCRRLKDELEEICAKARLSTKSSALPGAAFLVLNRLAVEELEAWFFGDCDAIRAAYPGVPASLENQARYRDPDAIGGGTWEALERVLQGAGYHRGGLPRIAAARAIALHMDPARNRSSSFGVFVSGLKTLVALEGP